MRLDHGEAILGFSQGLYTTVGTPKLLSCDFMATGGAAG